MDEALLVTRTTYRVSDFLSWQRQGALNLRPPFQRLNVWNKKSKSFFIDTVVRGFPVPLLFLQDSTDPRTYEPHRIVVDGQQRLRTVLAYVDPSCLDDFEDADDFKVMKIHNKDLHSKSFSTLAGNVQQRILQFQFSVNVLPPATPNRLLLEVFARMNATGSQLKDQELRNAEFNGAFKQFAYTLSYGELERCLRWKLFSGDQIARMKDVEFTSELVMFLLSGVTSKNQKAITDTYKVYDDELANTNAIAKRHGHVLDKIDEAYSGDLNEAYGREFHNSVYRTQGWLYCLFALLHDSMYVERVCDEPRERPKALNADRLRAHLEEREEALASAALPEVLLKSLRGAATDRSSREARYRFLQEEFDGAS